MKLYFDNNVYNRPFDDWSIPRNRVEALAVLELFERVVNGEVDLVSSFIVQDEHYRLKDPNLRERVGDLIFSAQGYVAPKPEIFTRAHYLEENGFGAADALHLAAAEYAGVDRFVTCDDKLSSKARRVVMYVRVISSQAVLEEEL